MPATETTTQTTQTTHHGGDHTSPTSPVTGIPVRGKPIKQADGTYRRPGPLTFTYTEYTSRRSWLRQEWFDAPALPWYEGQRQGMDMALELFAYMRSHTDDNLIAKDVVKAALKANDGPVKGLDDPSRTTVAMGFMTVVGGMMGFAVQHAHFTDYIEREKARLVAEETRMEAYYAKQAKDIGQRAAATRKARREARAAEAAA